MPWIDATGVRPSVLAQKTGVTKQAMSQLIKMIEERGYVETVPDTDDTRAKVVKLTHRGVALKKAAADVREEYQQLAIQTLGKARLDRLGADLAKLIEAYGRT
jgi:DNA-binding MarR family transcriptional regulator